MEHFRAPYFYNQYNIFGREFIAEYICSGCLFYILRISRVISMSKSPRFQLVELLYLLCREITRCNSFK